MMLQLYRALGCFHSMWLNPTGMGVCVCVRGKGENPIQIQYNVHEPEG